MKNKKILIGITGGIAAYKILFLIRLFKKQGAEVKVIMTEAAKDFVTVLTVASLSENDVFTDAFDKQTGHWNSHINLGIWADIFLIAPATANTIAKMANGIADNLLTTTYLSARSKIVIAPAMDMDMYKHPTTQKNIKYLQNLEEHYIIEPESGELASGLKGEGRLAEPKKIFDEVLINFQ